VVYPEGVVQDAQATARPAADREVIEQILAKLREHGGRATSARRLLLGALLENPGHHSAEQLAAAVQARDPHVNVSTIYRNLDELERLKIIDRAHLGHGPASYHLATGAHGHFVCENCGSMTEVPGHVFTSLAETARIHYGFTIAPHRFAVTGLCANCH